MFKFPLQRLLDLKARHEQEMARQLAAARTAATVEEERCQTIASIQSAGADHVAASSDANLSVGELVSMRHALSQIAEHLDVANERAAAAREIVTARNEELSGAVQDRQVLDRLRDRRLELHRAEENQLDRAAMDAVALSRFNSPRPGNEPA